MSEPVGPLEGYRPKSWGPVLIQDYKCLQIVGGHLLCMASFLFSPFSLLGFSPLGWPLNWERSPYMQEESHTSGKRAGTNGKRWRILVRTQGRPVETIAISHKPKAIDDQWIVLILKQLALILIKVAQVYDGISKKTKKPTTWPMYHRGWQYHHKPELLARSQVGQKLPLTDSSVST